MARRQSTERDSVVSEVGLAKECRLLVREAAEYVAKREEADQVEVLATRRQELSEFVQALEALVTRVQCLRTETQLAVTLAALRSSTDNIYQQAKELGTQVAEDVMSLGRPRALEAFTKTTVLKQIDLDLKEAWRRFVSADEHQGLEAVIARFPSMCAAARRIASVRARLQRVADTVPDQRQQIDEARRLKDSLALEIQQLEGDGLDEEVVEFLRQSVEGVPLGRVLSDDRLLAWMKTHNLLEAFSVKAR